MSQTKAQLVDAVDGSIVAADLASNCVTTAKVADDAITIAKLSYIYVLSSLSEKIEIQSIKNLYKIGYCTSSVEKRIENSEKETTFLMSGVKIVSAYKTFNLNPQKFENIIHNFFSERCLDIKISDLNGKLKKPKEWYIVPIRIIEEAIQLIINNQIQNYKFDQINDKIIKI